MNVGLSVTFRSHLSVEVVEDGLGLSNPRLILLRGIQSRFTDNVQKTWENFIVTHDTADCSCAHSDKCTRREGILRNAFLVGRFVVVCAIVEERVDGLSGKRIYLSCTASGSAVHGERIRIKGSNRLPSVAMDQSDRK